MQLPVAFVNPLSALSTLYDFLKRAFPINFQYLMLPNILLEFRLSVHSDAQQVTTN